MTVTNWAERLAHGPPSRSTARRWAHVQGGANKVERAASSLALSDDIRVAAAWLHDVGYARDVIGTGFHPLGGACYLVGRGARSTP